METPCETSSFGAAAQRLPGVPEEGREQGRGGGRQKAETPRRDLGESLVRRGAERGGEEPERRQAAIKPPVLKVRPTTLTPNSPWL